jgi:hypothetical protein
MSSIEVREVHVCLDVLNLMLINTTTFGDYQSCEMNLVSSSCLSRSLEETHLVELRLY